MVEEDCLELLVEMQGEQMQGVEHSDLLLEMQGEQTKGEAGLDLPVRTLAAAGLVLQQGMLAAADLELLVEMQVVEHLAPTEGIFVQVQMAVACKAASAAAHHR